jgi:phosphoenolpyruvate carboxykinase (ATP)
VPITLSSWFVELPPDFSPFLRMIFQNNMLIRPTEEELANFGEPDFIIYNAGQFPANRFTKGMSSTTSVEINFKRMEMVILGTEYAGEMKKGVFSVMVSRLDTVF